MKTRIKKLTNEILSKAFNVKIYSTRAHGREDVCDMANVGQSIRTVFDVGANIGQSVEKFRSAFPESTIYSFEPVGHIYERLKQKYENDKRVNTFNLALGGDERTAKIYITPHETACSIIEPVSYDRFEEICVTTLDKFCAGHDVSSIDLLKVDTEGFDLEVLRGGAELLSSGRVGLVLVELGFDPNDGRHVLFDDIRNFLIKRDFSLYGIYDQQLEWSGERRLRYANACFIKRSWQ